MKISLQGIDASNWTTCIFLTTDPQKEHKLIEEFVASNAVSLVQAAMEPGWTTRAIYHEETMIGFAMYGYSHSDQRFELCRLMIDYRFQRRGFGRQALRLIMDEMSRNPDCSTIYLSFDPHNDTAKTLYEEFGFQNTGHIVEDEWLYSLEVLRKATR